LITSDQVIVCNGQVPHGSPIPPQFISDILILLNIEGHLVIAINRRLTDRNRRQVREKPNDEEQCRQFLRSYRDHPAEAFVGIVVSNTKTGAPFESI